MLRKRKHEASPYVETCEEWCKLVVKRLDEVQGNHTALMSKLAFLKDFDDGEVVSMQNLASKLGEVSGTTKEVETTLPEVPTTMPEVQNPQPAGQRKQILLLAKKIKDFQKVVKDVKAIKVEKEADPNMQFRVRGLEDWRNRFEPNEDHIFGSVSDKIPPLEVWKKHVDKTLLSFERQLEEVLGYDFSF